MKHALIVAFIVLLTVFSFRSDAFAQSSPKLYPNKKLKGMTTAEFSKTIATCESEAKGSVGVGGEQGGRQAVRGAAKGAAMGALAGAITKQNTGRATGAGAALGGTSAALQNAKTRREGSPEYKSYVSACLEDNGLKVVGWE